MDIYLEGCLYSCLMQLYISKAFFHVSCLYVHWPCFTNILMDGYPFVSCAWNFISSINLFFLMLLWIPVCQSWFAASWAVQYIGSAVKMDCRHKRAIRLKVRCSQNLLLLTISPKHLGTKIFLDILTSPKVKRKCSSYKNTISRNGGVLLIQEKCCRLLNVSFTKAFTF